VLRAQFKFERFRFYALDFNSSHYKRHAATAAAQEVQPIRPNIQVGFQIYITERRPKDAPIVASDAQIADIFHDAFREPIDSPTREAMRALLFPSPCERSNSALLTALVE
jgi:hypothetical protein